MSSRALASLTRQSNGLARLYEEKMLVLALLLCVTRHVPIRQVVSPSVDSQLLAILPGILDNGGSADVLGRVNGIQLDETAQALLVIRNALELLAVT